MDLALAIANSRRVDFTSPNPAIRTDEVNPFLFVDEEFSTCTSHDGVSCSYWLTENKTGKLATEPARTENPTYP